MTKLVLPLLSLRSVSRTGVKWSSTLNTLPGLGSGPLYNTFLSLIIFWSSGTFFTVSFACSEVCLGYLLAIVFFLDMGFVLFV